ncbi:hypothetical protein ABZ260_38870, partial [Streptosporangium sp. NPDC006013]|uniref:hypothetical protein n=1 Tax=Streptosporangium sp. NPDC006013 TaxID=3155596 RepID=UPI0033B0CE70
EDSGRVGGVGDAVARLLRDADVDVPVRTYGILRAGREVTVSETTPRPRLRDCRCKGLANTCMSPCVGP